MSGQDDGGDAGDWAWEGRWVVGGWSVGGAVTPRARAEVRRDGGVEKTKAENISKEKTRSNVDRKKSFKPWDSLSGHF